MQRNVALARRDTFAIQTTFSGNSERRLIADARGLGCRVVMTYIALDDPEQNVARVNRRTVFERRTVPADVVIRRYERSLANLGEIVDILDLLTVIDNSEDGFQRLLTLERGRVIDVASDLPEWTRRALQTHLKR